MEFECIDKHKTRTDRWKGRISSLRVNEDYYEFWIESRSSIFVVIGKTSRGGFACMPDYNAGCHIVDFLDEFWNREKLTRVLGKVDGITVASAVAAIGKIELEQSQ